MNWKKRVIFYFNSDLQYSSEFNENIKIRMLKSYLKDVSHLEKFNLITHGCNSISDEMALKDVSPGTKEVFFRVLKPDSIATIAEKQVDELLIENNSLKIQNNELNDLIFNYKNEQEQLRYAIEELNSKCHSYQKAAESFSQQNAQLITTINNLKNELTELKLSIGTHDKKTDKNRKSMTNITEVAKESYSSRNKQTIEKRDSMRRNDSMAKRGWNTERKVSMKKQSIKIQQPTSNRENGSVVDRISSTAGRTTTTEVAKRQRTSSSISNGIKNGGKIESPWKSSDVEHNRLSVSKFFSKEKLCNNFWETVFQFLPKRDVANFSCTSKNNHTIFNMYYKDVVKTKLSDLKEQVEKRKSEILAYKFTYSSATNSTIKILNKANFSLVFLSPDQFLPEVLVIYRLLFQITHISDNNIVIQDSEFDKVVKAYFSDKLSIGDHIKGLNCDFSEENIDHLSAILEKFKIKQINCAALGKLEKTSGMISLLVRECLVFCGLLPPENEKQMQSSSSKERLAVFKDLCARKSCIVASEKVLKKLESLGGKFNVDHRRETTYYHIVCQL